MKDGQTMNTAGVVQREMSERQAAVLDELQTQGENGCASMYLRGLQSVKTRLIMDDEYEPNENLSLVRVLTLLEADLKVLRGDSEED